MMYYLKTVHLILYSKINLLHSYEYIFSNLEDLANVLILVLQHGHFNCLF